MEPNWASQLADFLANNKAYFQNNDSCDPVVFLVLNHLFANTSKQLVRTLLRHGKAGMKNRLKASDLEPKKLIPKLVVTKTSFL